MSVQVDLFLDTQSSQKYLSASCELIQVLSHHTDHTGDLTQVIPRLAYTVVPLLKDTF